MGLQVETQLACQSEDFVTLWTMEITFASNFGLLHCIIFSLLLKEMQVQLTMREARKDICNDLQV